jgi:membrane fusion protein, multidrug efflux system
MRPHGKFHCYVLEYSNILLEIVCLVKASALVSAVLLAATTAVAAATEPLVTATAANREVDETYVADGVVEAVRQSTVSAQIAGRVVAVNFDVGDHVKQGEVIVRIDPRQVTQAAAESQAQVAQARARFEDAKASFERTRQLFQQQFVSQAALDKSKAEFEAAQAQLQATRAGLGVAETTREFANVVAPYSGVVSARLVELGEMASPGTPLMAGFDPRQMRVVAHIPQYKVAAVRAASSATVEVPAANRRIKAAKVTVLPAADPRSLTTSVRLELPGEQRDLSPGMFARVRFVIGRATKLVVPARAVLRRSEVTAVYVVDDQGRPHLRQVRTGDGVNDDWVEILAGVNPDEKVALDPVKAGIARQ